MPVIFGFGLLIPIVDHLALPVVLIGAALSLQSYFKEHQLDPKDLTLQMIGMAIVATVMMGIRLIPNLELVGDLVHLGALIYFVFLCFRALNIVGRHKRAMAGRWAEAPSRPLASSAAKPRAASPIATSSHGTAPSASGSPPPDPSAAIPGAPAASSPRAASSSRRLLTGERAAQILHRFVELREGGMLSEREIERGGRGALGDPSSFRADQELEAFMGPIRELQVRGVLSEEEVEQVQAFYRAMG
ncbi:MAG: hypothetical protein EA397_00545 [Deltaproteobacteria bacterium]|nr:MAG: hypothetical protein EA397_00545 [Deltaproteobacteria bacterium]